MTLRLLDADGRQTIARIPGGPADPTLRAGPANASTTVLAQPGDDLNALAARFDLVRLSKGTYRLERPLILNQAVAIVGEPGATLLFAQPTAAPPWTAAIKIHDGRTRLEGFAVRFAGPVRWADNIDYGPAVIGTTDNHDPGSHGLKAGLVFRKLDLESPPPSSRWEEAVRLIRLATAENGRIEDNTLRGGMVEFLGGPWRVTGNDYRGTIPGTFCFGVFSGHRTHDLTLVNNTARPVGRSGKTWRFLVLTVSGASDLIRDNRVSGIGPRDDDPVHENAPEIILTEAYRLRFEGRPRAISGDGLVLVIPEPQGDPAEPGDAVAILEGPHAGTFRRIAQRIDRTTYLIDPATPLPRDVPALSLASGFVGERFEANTIDGRGGSVAAGFVLVGNHYGTALIRNHILGCGEAIRLTAAPTENPGPWGWSHAARLRRSGSGQHDRRRPAGRDAGRRAWSAGEVKRGTGLSERDLEGQRPESLARRQHRRPPFPRPGRVGRCDEGQPHRRDAARPRRHDRRQVGDRPQAGDSGRGSEIALRDRWVASRGAEDGEKV